MPNTREATDKMWQTRRAKYGKSGVTEEALQRMTSPPHGPRISKERAESTPWGWLRWQLRITQPEMARMTGANVASVRDWERRTAMPTLRSYIALLRLAKENGLDRSFTARSLDYITENPTVTQMKKRKEQDKAESVEEHESLDRARAEASTPTPLPMHSGWLRRIK